MPATTIKRKTTPPIALPIMILVLLLLEVEFWVALEVLEPRDAFEPGEEVESGGLFEPVESKVRVRCAMHARAKHAGR